MTQTSDPALWLVRHAVVPDSKGICYGTSDWPSDIAATKAAAHTLAATLPQGLSAHVSPLRRCLQLAAALQALRPDLRPQPDARLREFDFGLWEGQRWEDIGASAVDAWSRHFVHAPPCIGAESVADLMTRVGAAWDAWRADHRPAIWITHAGVIRAVKLLAKGLRLPRSAADWPREAIPFGTAFALHAPGESYI